MIKVFKLNGQELIINAELVETVQSLPDTTITLTTGNKILVRDKSEEIIEKILEYRRKVNQEKVDS